MCDESGAKRYDLKVPPIDLNSTLDYALLESTQNIGQEWGVARLADRVPEAGESLVLIHHPGGAAKHITRGRCDYLGYKGAKADSFEHSCDSLGGSSGAPLFLVTTGEVVAIHNRGTVIRERYGKGFASFVGDIAESSSLISEVISNQTSAVEPTGVRERSDSPNITQCKSRPVFVQHLSSHDVEIKFQNDQCVISVNGATKVDGGMECEEHNAIIYRPSTVAVNKIVTNSACTFTVN